MTPLQNILVVHFFSFILSRVNSLWCSDTIWRHKFGSTLVPVMACCLMAPSHYLNQCWLIISKVQWHPYQEIPQPSVTEITLLWPHNGPDGVSNHQPHECLLNRLFGHRSKKTSKLRVTGLCVGNSPETGEFPAQMASNAENISIWWRHHELENHLSKIFVKSPMGQWVKSMSSRYHQ